MNEQPDQISAVKTALVKQAQQMYQLFIEQINKFPSQAFAKQQSLIRFDEGLFWLTQSLNSAPIQLKNVATEAVKPPVIDELTIDHVDQVEHVVEPDAA